MTIRERLEDLDWDHVWDVVSALRGPDFNTCVNFGSVECTAQTVLKAVTTGVIRWFAGISHASKQGVVYNPAQARWQWNVHTPETHRAVRRLWHNSYHFRSHVESAFRSLLHEEPDAYEHWEWLKTVLYKEEK